MYSLLGILVVEVCIFTRRYCTKGFRLIDLGDLGLRED